MRRTSSARKRFPFANSGGDITLEENRRFNLPVGRNNLLVPESLESHPIGELKIVQALIFLETNRSKVPLEKVAVNLRTENG